jgi:hypothetical protein
MSSAKTADTLFLSDLDSLSQKWVTDAVDALYANIEGFDKEAFLIGTFDDDIEHYQTFTANKSINDINDSVKWMFADCLEFIPDTMAYQRITTYGNDMKNEDLALLTVALFKKDYPDMRALRVCNVSQYRKHYGSEIRSHYDPADSVCNRNNTAMSNSPYEIALYSSTLAKRVAGFFNFDNTLPYVISSGGDIGYRGVINSSKLLTKGQKMSFLIGVFMRHGCDNCISLDNSLDTYSILMRNFNSSAALCSDILKEAGCEHISHVDFSHVILQFIRRQIIFIPSAEIRNLIKIAYDVDLKLMIQVIF